MDSDDTNSNVDVREYGDEQLVADLKTTLRKERGLTTRLLAFMAEVDARGLYRKYAYSSMFEFAVHALHMSESEAYVRIHAARTSRRYPMVLDMLARGELHLSGLRLAAPFLTTENHLELLAAMRHKSKRAIDSMLAARFPKQDVRSELRKLPDRAKVEVVSPALSLALEPALDRADASDLPLRVAPPAFDLAWANGNTRAVASDLPAGVPDIARHPVLVPARVLTVSTQPTSTLPAAPAVSLAHDVTHRAIPFNPAPAPLPSSFSAVPRSTGGSSTVAPAMAPLRVDRYKVQFTASQQLHDKIKQAQHLLRLHVPDGDITVILERALDLLIAQRMSQRFAQPKSSARKGRASQTPQPGSRHIPNEVKRQVLARDGALCTFVSDAGRRCQERGGLEFHHKEPFARGGATTVDNVFLMCRAHNALCAEQDYGRTFMKRRIESAADRRMNRDSKRKPLSDRESCY